MEARAICLMILFIIVPAAVPRAFAAVTNVTHPAYYVSITSAVNAALSGDQLLVSTGLYIENIVIAGKGLNIAGGYSADFQFRTNNAQLTVVCGAVGGPVCSITTGGGLQLEGMSLTGGVAVIGGGVYVAPACSFTGLFCRIEYNASEGGGGMYIATNASVVLSNSLVRFNRASVGGGIVVAQQSRLILHGPTMMVGYNAALDSGGGVYCYNGNVLVEGGASVAANVAANRGGGLFVSSNATLVVKDANTVVGGYWLFYNAVTNGDGGGIYADRSSILVSGAACRVVHNSAAFDGGGIFLSNSTLTVMDGAEIGGPALMWNAAFRNGGGIYAHNSSVLITNNAAVNSGLASESGGGIYAAHSTIRMCEGATLGATNMAEANYAANGGGLVSFNCSGIFTRARILNNTAYNRGGGIMHALTGQWLITDSIIAGNFASNTVGGMLVEQQVGEFIINHSAIVSNRSGDSIGGLAWLMSRSPLLITNASRIACNSASNIVGGLYAIVFTTVSVCHSEISDNRANNGYGGGLAAMGVLEVIGSVVQGNSGDDDNDGTGDCGGLGMAGPPGTIRVVGGSTIAGNRAVCGAGIFISGPGQLEAGGMPPNGAVFAGNTASANGGGLYLDLGAHALLIGDVVFNSNRAQSAGACFVNSNSVLRALPTNGMGALFVNNVADVAGGALLVDGSNSLAETRLTRFGAPGAPNVALHPGIGGGGAVFVMNNGEYRAINCIFDSNISSNFGGAVSTWFGARRVVIASDFSAPHGTLPLTRFVNNQAKVGGAIMSYFAADMQVADALIASNRASAFGGALAFYISQTGSFVNVVMAGNSASNADAIVAGSFGTLAFQQCTIAGNNSNGFVHGGGAGVPLFENCIVWGHAVQQLDTNATVRFSDVQGGCAGLFNISNNPAFINPAALDYQLAFDSPCINQGATLWAITNDCIGNPRPYDGGWDMGAYEFVPEPGSALVLALITMYNVRLAIGRRRK